LKKYGKGFGMYALIITFILLIVSINSVLNPPKNQEEYSFSKLITQIKQQEIARIEIITDSDTSSFGRAHIYFTKPNLPNAEVTSQSVEGKLKAELKPKPDQTIDIVDMRTFVSLVTDAVLLSDYETSGLIVTTTIQRTSWIVSMLPMIVTVVIAIFLLMFILQQMQSGGGGGKAMSFGKTKARVVLDDKNKLTFDEVAGLEEEKAELEEVVAFLKHPKKFVDIGAKIPKGVLLVGPPGTGKTYLAKAVAGEAGVPFFSISGSDFVEMFVGVGASRVRDLFEQAKKNLPCIIFIDEIDAVGRKRGAGLGGGHDEREQTLNQLLVEMDGFGVNEGIIIIAATNRHDILDPALLRPGRFDRHISVARPDVKGREAVLKVHCKGKKLSPEVDLNVVAKTTSGFTPADLANLLNESALLAARFDKPEIGMEELRKAYVKITVGTEKKSHVMSQKEKNITAYHEAGHALLHELLAEVDPTYLVSIIPTGMAGGYTMHLPGEDKSYSTKKFMEETLITFFGGRAAEAIVIKDITTGASNDIERATKIARNMVTKYGMSEELGPIQFGDDNDEVFIGRDLAHTRNYGEKVASVIDTEVKRIIKFAYDEAVRLINENIDVLHKIAELLLENEKVTGEEIRNLLPEGSVKGFVKEGFMVSDAEL
jgi:cell division protease FtsH